MKYFASKAFMLTAVALVTPVQAQEAVAADEVAETDKKLSNPVAAMIMVS
jgi:hypothetical protein